MSVSFYADIQFVGDETTPDVRMHIGQTTNHSVTVDGNMFPSFADLIAFLKFNETRTRIENEYGAPYTVAAFEKEFLDATKEERAFQYNWVVDHNDVVPNNHWLDADGFTMSSGVWF